MPERVAVHLLAWGESREQVERAVHAAGQSSARNAWDFVAVERLTGAPCPLNVRETGGGVIAADAGYGWAYVAKLDRGAR